MLSRAGTLWHGPGTRGHPAGEGPAGPTAAQYLSDSAPPGGRRGRPCPEWSPSHCSERGRAARSTPRALRRERIGRQRRARSSAHRPPQSPARGDGAAPGSAPGTPLRRAGLRPSRSAASRPRRRRPHTRTSPRRRQKAPHVRARSRPSPAEQRGAEPGRAARRVKRFPRFARSSRGAAAGVGPFVPRESFPAKGKARASLSARLEPAAFVSARGAQPLPRGAAAGPEPRGPASTARTGRSAAPRRGRNRAARRPSETPRRWHGDAHEDTAPAPGGDAHLPGKTGPRPPVRGRSRGAPGAAGGPDSLPPHAVAPGPPPPAAPSRTPRGRRARPSEADAAR